MKSKYNPEKHHRRSIRLKGYDYSSNGAYYVTFVTQGREHFHGKIINKEMILNDAGQMIVKWWNEIPNKFPNVVLGASVVMPNHFHCIIYIVGADLRVRPLDLRVRPNDETPKSSLSQIVQWFKTMTTNEYIRGVKQLEWKPFSGKLWQRDYYEHIIRNERELKQKTDYILDNPSRWDDDREGQFNQ
ncbi:MAG TPA: transposase [Anaerolineales bacterium]|nr:transposase [Anaerolineales bacterium]